ncbi:MAG: hypothetical protein DRO93_06775 [Candidatus Thorarchaeota archaeon]|nr:MAG: hypothetical protein DRO93_06775 [Candidatus Thorarchaeota archaeon]
METDPHSHVTQPRGTASAVSFIEKEHRIQECRIWDNRTRTYYVLNNEAPDWTAKIILKMQMDQQAGP